MSAQTDCYDGRVVVIHSKAHAEAALAAAEEAGKPVALLSPPAAAKSWGAAYFNALIAAARGAHPAAESVSILDCGAAAGHALGAIREGVEAVCFTGQPEVGAKLRDIAAQAGVGFLDARPDACDLQHESDPAAICRRLLA